MNAADAKKANTALHLAVSKNHAATCAYLVRREPCHRHAVTSLRAAVCRAFVCPQLKKNANAAARNKAGKTPAQLAATDEIKALFAGAARPGSDAASSSGASSAAAADAASAAPPVAPAAKAAPEAAPAAAPAAAPTAAAPQQLAMPKSSLPPPQLGKMAPPQLGKMAPPQLGKMAPPKLGTMAPPQLGGAGGAKKRAAPDQAGGAKQARPAGPALSFADEDE